MQKKFIYIGLILVLVFFISLYGLSYYFSSKIQSTANLYTNKTVFIGPENSSYFSLQINNLSRFILIAKPNISINFYLFNSSGFNAWQNSNPKNAIFASANTSSNKGIIAIINNSDLIRFPILSNFSYKANITKQVYNQSYYFVFNNPTTKPTSTQVTYLYMNQEFLPISNSFAEAGFAIFIILIIGIGFIIFGILKKNKNAKDVEAKTSTQIPEDVEKMYSKIESEKTKEKQVHIKHSNKAAKKIKKSRREDEK